MSTFMERYIYILKAYAVHWIVGEELGSVRTHELPPLYADEVVVKDLLVYGLTSSNSCRGS